MLARAGYNGFCPRNGLPSRFDSSLGGRLQSAMRELYFVAGAAILTALVIAALRIALTVRGMAMRSGPPPEDDLEEFRQMRDEGKITEEEFQRLRRAVAEQSVKQARSPREP
jgi:hypothetical protein